MPRHAKKNMDIKNKREVFNKWVDKGCVWLPDGNLPIKLGEANEGTDCSGLGRAHDIKLSSVIKHIKE